MSPNPAIIVLTCRLGDRKRFDFFTSSAPDVLLRSVPLSSVKVPVDSVLAEDLVEGDRLVVILRE